MCLEKVLDSWLYFRLRRRFNPYSITQGTATRNDIDKTLRLGMNHPMGPLALGELTRVYSD